MELDVAIDLLSPHVRATDLAWADIGAGDGLFTRALARLLGPNGIVHAVDRDPEAVHGLEAIAVSTSRDRGAQIVVHRDDLRKRLDVPPVDGVLLANVLHFVPVAEQGTRLNDITSLLVPEGRIVVIEYDNRAANRWVPYPVSRRRLTELAAAARLTEPLASATRASAFGGLLYVAVMTNSSVK